MNLRIPAVIALICMFSGCSDPTEVSVPATELTFNRHAEGVLSFRAQVRAGDFVCWQHGENGHSSRNVSEDDRDITLTISSSSNRLGIVCGDGGVSESIPVESVVLIEKPTLTNGKYHVGNYVRKLGVTRTPETPLYIYVQMTKGVPTR